MDGYVRESGQIQHQKGFGAHSVSVAVGSKGDDAQRERVDHGVAKWDEENCGRWATRASF
jgi:hypothetical protein